jgi:hypothetical protein
MDEDDDIDQLFDWMGDTYQSDNLGSATTTVDLTEYEVTFFHNKDANGDEYLDPFEVTKANGSK